jgi:N-dimethylarginine dimethylaminohydrolase
LRSSFGASLNTDDVVIVTDTDVRFDVAAINEHVARFLSQRPKGLYDLAAEVAAVQTRDVEKLAAPIIETKDDRAKGQGIIMTCKDRALDLYDRLKLRALRESFIRSGVEVTTGSEQTRPVPLWVRDAYFLAKDIAYVSDAGARQTVDLGMDANGDLFADHGVQEMVAQRIGGVDEMLRAMGQTSVLLRKSYFEGGDLIPDYKTGRLFWGDRHGQMTYGSLVLLRFSRRFEKLNLEVVAVKTDRTHYHLDLGLSPMLSGGEFLLSPDLGYESGYGSGGTETLTRMLGKKRIIALSYEEATVGMATNLTVIGNTLFMTSCSPPLRGDLARRGYIVNAPPYILGDPARFRRIGSRHSGGGVHCLTNEFAGGTLPKPAP